MGDNEGARESSRWRMCVLGDGDVARLHRFFDANLTNFLALTGEPPRADEAERELRVTPGPEMPYREMRLLGFTDRSDAVASGAIVAMTFVVADLIAEHVWHLGLFIVATALHGSGAARAIYADLERRIGERGAHWIRLGVAASKHACGALLGAIALRRCASAGRCRWDGRPTVPGAGRARPPGHGV
jgi:hypothetical protein